MKRTLTALVGALALSSAGVLAGAAPAAAAARHVGVVVRYANGNVSAGCASAGGNGLQVLGQHHSVVMGTQQYSGFVLKIDNVGTSRPDNTHYWSYWHSKGGGSWTYSGSGAGSYTPPAGTVEGWSYVNGQSNAPRPPSYTYSALCGNLDPKPTPQPTPKPTPKPSPKPTPHAKAAPTRSPTSHAYVAPPPPRARASAASAPAHPIRRTGAHPSPHRRQPPSHATPGSSHTLTPLATPTTDPATAPVPSAASPTLRPTASPTHDGGFPAWGTALALLLVAALGALALILTRRRAG